MSPEGQSPPQTAPQTPPLGLKEVFAIVPFRRLAIANLVSTFGDFLAMFAMISIVSFRLHGTPEQVAGIMIAFMLPMAFVSPAAGVFVDRWNVKRTLIASDLIRAALILILIFSSSLWSIYGVLVALSVVSSFFIPSQTIGVRSIVPTHGLMSANAASMQIMQVTQILTPGLAALLVKGLGERSCFWLDAGSFVFSAAMVSSIPIGRAIPVARKALATVFHDMGEGLRYIFTHATLGFTILSMSAGMFAVRCFSALIAVYVRDILHADAGLFGFVSVLVGVGMIIGTQFLTLKGKSLSKEHLMMSGLFVIALGILLLAVFGNVLVTVLATLTMGFGVALVMISAQTLMQGQTPLDMLGRVTSTLMSVLSFAQVAGLALSGCVAQAIGIRNSYYGAAALMAVIAAAGWRLVNHRTARAAAVA
jgi:MFS family permease